MRVLVTGATGFVGQALVRNLKVQGFKVGAANRRDCKTGADSNYIVGDLNLDADMHEALRGCDFVIHLAARVHVLKEHVANPLAKFLEVNVHGTINLARQAAAAGVKRFVYVSSIKVNGEFTTDKPFLESDVANPQDAYAFSKWQAEQALQAISQETGMEVVIIRPPLVYGPGVKANFASMMRAVQLGIPLPLGAIHNKRSFVYVGNLVSLILRCIDHPAAANQIFLVSDGNDLSTTELLRRCAKAFEMKARLLPVPQSWIEFGARLLGKQDIVQRLCDNLQVDITKVRTVLDWTPPVSIEDGLKATALGLIQDR